MAEQRQPFRFRIPWLPGASAPARSPAEPTQYTVAEAPVAAERIPFQPIARPPFRPAGIAQVPPPPPLKAPSPPKRPLQPPALPRMAPEVVRQDAAASLPPVPSRPEITPSVVSAASPPVPSRPEITPSVVSQSQFPGGTSAQGNLKSDAAESIPEAAQPKETPLPAVPEPESSNEKPAKPVAFALLFDPVQADPPKAFPPPSSETSSSSSVSQPSTDLQRETTSPAPAERLVEDKKPMEPLVSALVPIQAKPDPLEPSSELKASSPPLAEYSSPSAGAQPSLELQQKETSFFRPLGLKVEDAKPVKPIDSAPVPKSDAVYPPEPTPPVPKGVPSASQESSSMSPVSLPSGESQGPFYGIIPKLQEEKRLKATDKEEARAVAATHPLTMPPVPEKEPKGQLPLPSLSHEPKRTRFIPKRRVPTASSHRSYTNNLGPHPIPAAARGSGSSSSSSSLQKEIKDDVSKLVQSITSGKANTSKIQELVDVIALVGENTGATMHLTSGQADTEERVHIRRNYRSNPDESVEGTTDVEEGEEWEIDGAEDEELENTAFLNSNVQGVNNSLVLDSSVSEGSPGIHFDLAPNSEPQLVSRSEAFKDEFGVTPAEKHTYKPPTIRRRCLRGLLLESTDSSSNDDEDNPTKSRRHGCRFGCEWKNDIA